MIKRLLEEWRRAHRDAREQRANMLGLLLAIRGQNAKILAALEKTVMPQRVPFPSFPEFPDFDEEQSRLIARIEADLQSNSDGVEPFKER